MWLTDLADVARAAGLDVREAPGWKTRGHGEMADVRTITCHHTGSTGTNDMSLTLLIAGRPDLSGPIANLGVGRSGRIYVVAAGRAYHAGESCDWTYTNSHAIGIEAEASGTDPWPAVQLDAYARLCRALADHYRLPYARVLGHKETCAPHGRKVDPNFSMDAFRARITALEDDDMPYTKDEISDAVWRTDRIPAPGKPTTGNVAWQADSYLRLTYEAVQATLAQTSAMNAALQAVLTAGTGAIDMAAVQQAAADGAEAALRKVAADVADGTDT